ncbi:hypothetical protein K437DRAFT_273102 [Tilletiaria anomala UBC 951]|uniref:Lysophospholipase NTE1 n=1 Tax=Tilletiaria anomala (strain ATCC 24038 / CBS 436.72 / UBC 951) TaxID=1037660 RepID=A0A066WCY4_TILAU|nr:uncharacterized protein K437DRAFT_273102 [Tilletiaria anomala UBC 951]KDN50368.1 hypothetical protein K437DRAFT_273102 [Tilletiaria anomala UBC 951]
MDAAGSTMAAGDAAAAAVAAAAAATLPASSTLSPLLARSTPPILQQAARLASTSRNPLALLLDAVLAVLIALFNIATVLIAFSTLTLPSLVYRILHYSFTLRLTFPSLALLFSGAVAAAFVWLRYRHLNRYERLRELPIEKDEGFNLHPDVNVPFFFDDHDAAAAYDYDDDDYDYASGRRRRGRAAAGGIGVSGSRGGGGRPGQGASSGRGGIFHNYLDDFLQAIRIFGFLEKPVFHELARHLQTRRLVAGDSLALDSDFSFYIVIDGNVQVYAPLLGAGARAGARFGGFSGLEEEEEEEEEDQLSAAGYQLLHEVQSGGTLSSLFTILSLFTEDVKLGFWNEAQGTHSHSHSQSGHGHTSNNASASAAAAAQSSATNLATGPAGVGANGITRPQPQLATPPLPLYPQQQEVDSGSPQRRWHLSADDALGDGASSHSTEATLSAPAQPVSAFGQMLASSARNAPPPGTAAGASPSTPNGTPSTGTRSHIVLLQPPTLGAEDAEALVMPPAEACAPFSHYLRQQAAAEQQQQRTKASSTPRTPSSPDGSGVPSPAHGHRSRGSAGNIHRLGAAAVGPAHLLNGNAVDGRQRRYSAGANTMLGSSSPPISQHNNNHQHHQHLPMFAAGPTMMMRERDEHVHPHAAHGPGTVARATVDTTLAVIPAEAFKRLTNKFPNASAHIVQVILTRLSRVTLHTAHKYLGLTKEVMRTEKTINQIACAPLPPSFYQSDGMDKLRQRFIKVSPAAPPAAGASNGLGYRSAAAPASQPLREQAYDTSDDGYFRQRGVSGASGRGMSMGIGGSSNHTTSVVNLTESPTADEASMETERPAGGGGGGSGVSKRRQPSGPGLAPVARPKTPWGHPDPPVRTPAARTTVGPGDLISTSGLDDRGAWAAQNVQMTLNTPRPFKSMLFSSSGAGEGNGNGRFAPPQPMSTIDDRKSAPRDFSSSSKHSRARAGSIIAAERCRSVADDEEIGWASVGLANFDLKDAVMSCIANCIGLVPAPASPIASVQASPFISAQDALLQRSVFNSAFGSLTMLDAAAGMADAESSVTGGSNSHAGAFPAELENDVQIRFFEAESVIIRAGEMQAGLYYVIDGFLDVSLPRAKQKDDRAPPNGQQTSGQHSGRGAPGLHEKKRHAKDAKPIYTVGRGGVAGYLSTLLGTSSYVDVTARTDCYVGFLPAQSLQKMMERRPVVLLTLCKRLLSLLSPLLLHIDSALDWQQVAAGQVIYRQGDEADSFYIVINGRLRAISEKAEGGAGIAGNTEFGQGDSVGELDVVTNSLRSVTLHAIRDSELAKMPMSLFNAISVRHPAVTIQMSRIIAGRVRAEVANKHTTASHGPMPGVPDLGKNNANLKTVAILPVTRDVPITAFASRLHSAFEDTIGQPAAYLNQQRVMGVLGRHAFNRMGKLKLTGWLADQEEKYRLVMYVVDTAVSSPWAQTSIRQADCILLVGFGDDPSVGEYERLLLGIKTTARKELVLLHPERAVPPGSTRAWLQSRPWVHAHHHVELPGIPSMQPISTIGLADQKAVKALMDLRKRIGSRIQQYREKRDIAAPARSHHFSDFSRLARRLCGKSIGLILGGGGARGCAHLGVLRALEERNIPIDIIGGTSIGSFVGGLYAREAGLVPSLGRVKKFSGRMASLWRFAIDLTYPYVSYTTGHEFNRGIFKAFADTHIEDMWLPFFCNTTNITWSKMEIHTTGYAWRYIRGSMTLAGLIPPLIDSGDMLVDGGYMDNLPVSVMFSMGAASVFAVDVGSVDDTSPRNYGDALSGWWVVLNRWNPWSDAIKIPSIPEIQGRLTYVSSVKTLEEAKAMPGCFYLRMPVEKFGTLEFGKFNEIMAIGYDTARQKLAEWDAAGVLPSGEAVVSSDEIEWQSKRKAGISARRNSV